MLAAGFGGVTPQDTAEQTPGMCVFVHVRMHMCVFVCVWVGTCTSVQEGRYWPPELQKAEASAFHLQLR